MLAKVWNILSDAGVDSKRDSTISRYIILTNRFGVITGLITIIILALLFFQIRDIGWTITRILVLISALLFFSIILLNKFGFYNLSRWVISWLPAILIVSISITDKLYLPQLTTIKDFFTFRFLLMATAIIPLLVFNTENYKLLLFNLIPSFVGTVLFDLLHKPFGVGFNQLGFNDPHFYMVDIMVALAYFGLIGFLLNQRKVTDSFELQLSREQKKLTKKFDELHHLNAFINKQNCEITTQSDKIKETNEELKKAKGTIESQKKLLEAQNKNLENQVLEKTKDLSRVHEELIINNNELRQFSHTLSHNLKSPVATFQGLLNLIEMDGLNDANKVLLGYLNQSVDKMQEVFSDMNEILELRNRLYTSIAHVDIKKAIDQLHNSFYPEIRNNGISFNCDCNGLKVLKTNEKRLNGILFQLISNSIKFRSIERKPEIKIKFNGTASYHSIKIWDNGIGIDLRKYGNKLFYPFQKFNNHTVGKGLGLYLVKLQTESLGGSVYIKSEPDSFTEVEVRLKK